MYKGGIVKTSKLPIFLVRPVMKNFTEGSYNEHFKTIVIWDPAIATIGGTWDEFLSADHNI
jgi:hypothetical protein